jgi:hypothetical protein
MFDNPACHRALRAARHCLGLTKSFSAAKPFFIDDDSAKCLIILPATGRHPLNDHFSLRCTNMSFEMIVQTCHVTQCHFMILFLINGSLIALLVNTFFPSIAVLRSCQNKKGSPWFSSRSFTREIIIIDSPASLYCAKQKARQCITRRLRANQFSS